MMKPCVCKISPISIDSLVHNQQFGRGYTSGTFARNGQFYVCGGLDKINLDVMNEMTKTQRSMECYDVRTGMLG